MAENANMKYLSKIANICAKLMGFECVFVEIRGVHLGHTLIESAYANYFKPIYVYFQKPEANIWLVSKISNLFRRNKILQLLKEKAIKNKKYLSFKDFQGIYNLLNLGFNVFPKSLPQISFSAQEKNDCEKFFKKYGLKKKNYILFCLRDETYYKSFKPDLAPGKNFGFRNSDLTKYVKAAGICKKMGLVPIRFGFSKNVSTPSVFFDINQCEDYRPWIEAYLAKNALFCAGNFTGSTLYCKIFKVPVLWIDVLWRGCVIGNPGDYLAPKNIRIGKQRLSFLSQKQLGPPKDNLFENYNIPELSVENLSSKIISNCIKEMVLRLEGKQTNTKFKKQINQFYKNHYQKMIKNGISPTPLLDSWISEFPEVLNEKSDQLEFNLYRKFWLGKNENWDPDKNHSMHLKKFYNYLKK